MYVTNYTITCLHAACIVEWGVYIRMVRITGCCRVDWGSTLEQYDITAEVRSLTSGRVLMKGLAVKVTSVVADHFLLQTTFAADRKCLLLLSYYMMMFSVAGCAARDARAAHNSLQVAKCPASSAC